MATAIEPAKIDIGRVIGRGADALRRNLIGFAAFALLLGGLPALAVDYLFQGVFSDLSFDGPLWTSLVASFIADFLSASPWTSFSKASWSSVSRPGRSVGR